MFLAFLSGSSGRLTGVYAGGGNKNPKKGRQAYFGGEQGNVLKSEGEAA
jgi:hypothetical protein